MILIKGFKIYKSTHKCILYEGEKVSNVKDYETTKIWKKKNVKICGLVFASLKEKFRFLSFAWKWIRKALYATKNTKNRNIC